MTDTLLAAPAAPLADDDYLDCGCCVRPPTAAADLLAALEARRVVLERRLSGLGDSTT